jgi:hypothetical protein
MLKGLTLMETWQGCLPTLMAATTTLVEQGAYFGPDGPGEMGGLPALGVIDDAQLDQDVASKLWALGEEATGTSFP